MAPVGGKGLAESLIGVLSVLAGLGVYSAGMFCEKLSANVNEIRS